MKKENQFELNPSKPFQFVSVVDCGDTCCPHCGAIGRYIYTWAEYGVLKSAMKGCYKMLTGKLEKDDVSKHLERISQKQSKNKPLNGWDKTIIRMQEYISTNSGDAGKVNWASNKIAEAVAQAKQYSARRF